MNYPWPSQNSCANDNQLVEVSHSVDALPKVAEEELGDEAGSLMKSIAIVLSRISVKAVSAVENGLFLLL